MKLSVNKCFIDKDTNIFHNVGEIVEYPEERAKLIENRGYGKIIDQKPTKIAPKAEKESELEKKDSLETKKERKKK